MDLQLVDLGSSKARNSTIVIVVICNWELRCTLTIQNILTFIVVILE